MSTNSNDKGRAYEYAWINALFNALSEIRNTAIINNSSFEANKRAWNKMPPEQQKIFAASADAALKTVFEAEPCMIEKDSDMLCLEFQKDDAGKQGDVRDIVIKRNGINWQIGLSIKHNHEAVKHSRLSHKLDFGKEWYGIPCSSEYWNDISGIFNCLSDEKSNNTKWSDIKDKDKNIYTPLLKAFIAEINRAFTGDPSVPRKLIEYLIGINDYYKIISCDSKKMTLIRSFNIHGTLNKPSKVKVSALVIPIVELPTELISVRFKPDSSNTVEMYLNNGWQLSFRIHNASTFVEPSLKFDIQFIGMPASVVTFNCLWN